MFQIIQLILLVIKVILVPAMRLQTILLRIPQAHRALPAIQVFPAHQVPHLGGEGHHLVQVTLTQPTRDPWESGLQNLASLVMLRLVVKVISRILHGVLVLMERNLE